MTRVPVILCLDLLAKLAARLVRVVALELVCRGVAGELKLKTSGRRNMLGCIAPGRNEQYFASTSPVLRK